MIYKSELPSVVISDCYIDRDRCVVSLEVIDSISYIRKLSITRVDDSAIIRVKKTIFKKLMGSQRISFPLENVERIIVKKWR